MGLLQAQAFRANAAKKFRAVQKGGDATATKAASKVLLAAYEAEITELRKQPNLAKQLEEAITAKVIHHERYEKKTVQEDPPPSSEPRSSEEEEEEESGPPASGNPNSGAPRTTPSEPGSSEEEEEEEEGGRRARRGAAPRMRRRAEAEEEEEEKALLAAFSSGDKTYRRDARHAQVDAVGYRGPLALLKACQKALGTTSIAETFGALQALPEKLAAASKVEAQVSRLAKNDRAARVDALLAKAKAEGKVLNKDARAHLRAEGIAKGTAHLKGMLAVWPAAPTQHPELDAEAAGAPFAAGGRDVLPNEPPAEALVGLNEVEKAEVLKQWKAAVAAGQKARS